MKKGLIFLIGIISFLGINTVKAEEIYFEYDTNLNEVSSYIDEIGKDVIIDKINYLIDLYYSNYYNTYPYYIVSLIPYTRNNIDYFDISLISLDSNDFSTHTYNSLIRYSDSSGLSLYLTYIDFYHIGYRYSSSSSTLDFFETNSIYPNYSVLRHYTNTDIHKYNPYSYYYSNFDFYYNGSLYTDDVYKNKPLTYAPTDTFYIPTFEDSSLYSTYQANEDFLVEPYYLYDNNLSLDFEEDTYTTIDLNQYSYVILTLKDYTPRDTFTSNMYVKGQLCATTVYNYGLEEKKDYISGYQTQGCGYYYNDFTGHLSYIKSEDITNHAIYYLTGYDSSKPNLVKVDTSVYDIIYITSENENEPYVSIEGKTYPALSYSSLTDSATLTEKNGISNTWTCAKYDTNCYLNSSGIDINNLFQNPLDTLQTIWSAIVSIFELITEFILLLPPPMQAFLFLAFGVGIAIGIIKILL